MPNCLAYSELSRAQSNFMDRAPTMRPMGVPLKAVQNIETNVPPGSTHGDEAAIDVVPQRQARAATKGFEFPPDILVTPVVLKHLGSVGSRHCCLGNLRLWRPHRGELHRCPNPTPAS